MKLSYLRNSLASQKFLLDDEVIGTTELDDIYQSMIHETRGRCYTTVVSYDENKQLIIWKLKFSAKESIIVYDRSIKLIIHSKNPNINADCGLKTAHRKLSFYVYKICFLTTDSVDCSMVHDTKDSNKTCIFPFNWNGTTHYSCNLDENKGYWCSTEVDETGGFIEGKWGICSSKCQGKTLPSI